ncbi:hypothetical protein CWATWH0401_2486 [Crocosphaera watsonii WH 0401]|uniref:Uncharacterized protein n=2 Tax=Crocosphaera watsonii TaxID=263511 RepID=T2JC95_CROWT|nr:hypothetical protein CWATWH0401_2486 [Crocosphaera watsonii WH 0401]
MFKYLALLLFSLNTKKNTSDRGFAILMVMALGTIGTLATAAMLAQSSTLGRNLETSVTISQQNLSVAQTAKVNLQALLIEHNQLLEYEVEDWVKYLKSPNSSQESRNFNHNLSLCREDSDWKKTKQRILNLAQQKMIDVPVGKFSLVDLQKVDSSQIIVTIKTENRRKNSAQYQVDINLSDNYLTNSVPVLWLTGKEQRGGIGEVNVKGNVWANDCSFPIEKVNLIDIDEHWANYTGIKIPELPELELIKQRLPEHHYFPSITEEERDDNDDDQEETISLELPREEDEATEKQGIKNVYEYLIDDIEQIDSLTINSDSHGESVIILHIVGDTNISEIVHQCQSSNDCSPENLIIVGYEGSKMCLNFDNLGALIVAPQHQLGIKNKNSDQEVAQFTGSIWVDKLSTDGDCGSDQVEFQEAWKWGDLPTQFQSINPIPKLIQVHLRDSITPDS